MTPKELFLRNESRSRKHRDLMDNPEFQEVLKDAFAQYCWSLPPSATPQSSWDNNSRRQGALEFIETLRTLGNPATSAQRRVPGELEPEGTDDRNRTA